MQHADAEQRPVTAKSGKLKNTFWVELLVHFLKHSRFVSFLLFISFLQQRIVFYTLMALSDDEESQKKGAVSVHINMDSSAGPRTFDLKASKTLPVLLSILPIRFVGIHICQDAIQLKKLVDIFVNAVESAIRVRIRAHFGK